MEWFILFSSMCGLFAIKLYLWDLIQAVYKSQLFFSSLYNTLFHGIHHYARQNNDTYSSHEDTCHQILWLLGNRTKVSEGCMLNDDFVITIAVSCDW